MFKEWKSIVAWSSSLSQTLLSCWILNSLFLQDGESSSKRRWARFAKRNKCPLMALLPALGKNRSDQTFYLEKKLHIVTPKNDINFLEKVSKNLLWMKVIYSSNFRGSWVLGCPNVFFTRKNSKSCSTKCPSWTKDGTSSLAVSFFPMSPVPRNSQL